MPYGCGELICADWQHNNWKSTEFASLKPGQLYYYSYAYFSPPEKLRDFQSLQNFIFSVSIHQDDELGWAFYINEDRHPWFPEPQEHLRVHLKNAPHLFKVVDVQRKLWIGSRRTPSGDSYQNYSTRIQRVIYCPESPEMLYEWLNVYLDMRNLIADAEKHRQTEMLLPLGILALMESVEQHSLYTLHPDLFWYKDYYKDYSRNCNSTSICSPKEAAG